MSASRCARDCPCFFVASQKLTHTNFSGYMSVCQTLCNSFVALARAAKEENPLFDIVGIYHLAIGRHTEAHGRSGEIRKATTLRIKAELNWVTPCYIQ